MSRRHVRLAARSLWMSPLFTTVTVVTLALAIGATTAIFSLMNSVVLSPLPYRDPGGLAIVQETVLQIRDRYPVLGANARSLDAWRKNCRDTCADFTAIDTGNKTLTGDGAPEGLVGARVLPNAFDLLGIPPLLGRTFRAGDDAPGSHVAVLAHGLWQRRFGARADVIGRRIMLDGTAYEVVGVLPPRPRFPRFEHVMAVPGETGEAEIFTPLAFTEDLLRNAGDFDLAVLLRLRPAATVVSAAAELEPITRAAFEGTGLDVQPIVRPLIERIAGNARRPFALLLAAGAAVLLVVCVNVAGLLAARWLGRQRELAIRTAMGASLRDLVGLVSAESALLALLGGGLGLATAYGGIGALVAAAPVSIPRLDEVAIDTRVLVFAAGLTIGAGVVCALVPAWRVWCVEVGELLKAGAHTTTGGAKASRARSAVVGAEVALTAALLVVAGLLVASLVRVLQVDRGFTSERVVAFDLELPGSRYRGQDDRVSFVDRLLSGVRAIPAVDVAGVVQKLPLEGEASVDAFVRMEDARPPIEQAVGSYLFVSPEYFTTLGIALGRGRLFSSEDRGRRVAVVSERAARTVWPDRDPIGQRLSRSNRNQTWEVVGVVRDVHMVGLEQQPGPVAYVPYWDRTAPQMSLVVRTKADPEQVARTLGQAVALVDPQLPLQRIRTMDGVVEEAVAARRFQMALTVAFAAAALLVACLGIYAVIAGAVQRRRPELAVRVALGATSRDVTTMVLSQGLRPVVWGLLAGMLAAAAAARMIAGSLFGISPLDPLVYAAVAALVTIVSAAACLEPAFRAARTSPLLLLRAQ